MSLTGAFNIGRSSLSTSQLAIQIAGNNLANAATAGYSRQVGSLSALRGGNIQGLSVGRGVELASVRRQVDSALQSRLSASVADEAYTQFRFNVLSDLESTLNELSDQDLSSELSAFFTAWSERANLSQSSGLVVRQGERLAQFVKGLREDLVDQRTQLDAQLTTAVDKADAILNQIADLNRQVARAEATVAEAAALRDQRDQLVRELSSLIDVSTVEQPTGSLDVLVGSVPVVLGTQSRGLRVLRESTPDGLRLAVASRADGQELAPRAGQIAALVDQRAQAINDTLDTLDALAANIIFEVNKLHSTGTNARGLTSATATLPFTAADRTVALNDPDNAALASLPFAPTNGGFLLHVKNPDTGATSTLRIDVDLDGLDAAGQPSTDDDTSLQDLADALNAAQGVSATITPEGKLQVTADQGFEFSFAEDSSGVLAVLGVNAYFTGSSAIDIDVRADLKADSSLLMSGRYVNGTFVENATALALTNLQNTSIADLDQRTIQAAWNDTVQQLASRTDAAKIAAGAQSLVRESLDAQRAAVSGVNTDEETINLLTFQRQYEGAARLISTVDQMFQTLISIV